MRIGAGPLLMFTVALSGVRAFTGSAHAHLMHPGVEPGHYVSAAPDADRPFDSTIDKDRRNAHGTPGANAATLAAEYPDQVPDIGVANAPVAEIRRKATAAPPLLLPAPPFGVFDTPDDGQQDVIGEVAVTGWALDDSGVPNVRIYRSPLAGETAQSNGLVFIGDAAFVRGARPDVAGAYPEYPRNDQAGWGYMLLSNLLPNGGNGTFTLYAIVTDESGVSTSLGEKTIRVNNAFSHRPFGTIDTPAQGQTVSGVIRNWGWALTPSANETIHDGRFIQVFIDGVLVGNPVYGLYRADIALAFPDYPNADSAVGYFDIDTRILANGVHTISWAVHDAGGDAAGIGSRYFTVENSVFSQALHETTPGAVLTLEADHDGINATHYVWDINGVDVVTDPVSVLTGGSFRASLTAPATVGTHEIGVRARNETEGTSSERLSIRIIVR